VKTRDIKALLIEEVPRQAGETRAQALRTLDAPIELITAESFSAGLERLNENPNFDAVILDLSVTEAHGIESIGSLQQAAPHTPILVLGEGSSEHLSRPVVQAGAQDFLVAERIDTRGLSAAIRNAIERHRQLTQLRNQVLHDALTGLPKRALFLQEAAATIESSRKDPRRQFAVLLLGLDRFKLINEGLGHACGDQVLITLTQRMRRYLRSEDRLARVSGDEFVILLNGLESAVHASSIAQCIQREAVLPIPVEGQVVFTTASVGVALGVPGYESAEELLRDAAIALHHAKQRGKGRFEIYEKSMHTRAVEQFQIEMELRRAVERGEFLLHFQPIVELGACSLVGFEVLLRWAHPTRGIVPPAEFIPLAEETGLITPIERWVFRKSCQQMRRWRKVLPADHPLSVSVNVSGKHLSREDLPAEIESMLRENDLQPAWLRIEITESAVVEKTETSRNLLVQLREIGVRLSVDDFGTGYSSLGCLHRFPVDTLKIDRSFVGAIDGTQESAELVRTILSLARSFRLEAIAEGIETEQQLEKLRELGCEFGQGFYFSKPVPAEAADKLVRAAASGTEPLRKAA
jgi:diguanylate cyclase (GGDEF)-like protein